MNNLNPLLILLPAFMVSLIGWIMVIVFFGKFDRENYKESGSEIRTDNVYNVQTVPFWLFAFGFPLTNVALALYAVTSYHILGVISQIFGTVCALFIGPCLYFFSLTFAIYNANADEYASLPYKEYYIAGFIGALLSMLSLVAMMGFMPLAKGFRADTNIQFSSLQEDL